MTANNVLAMGQVDLSSNLAAEFEQNLKSSREGLASAARTVEQHYPQGGLCACFRPLPCGVREVLERRREDHERALAALLGPTYLIPVVSTIEDAVPPAVRLWRLWWPRRLTRNGAALTAGPSPQGRPA